MFRYGDIVPLTNAGQFMAIFLMISGTFYMSMPLTAAAGTFYQVHQQFNQDRADEKAEAEAQLSLLEQTQVTPKENALHRDPVLNARLQLSINHMMREAEHFEETVKEVLDDLIAFPELFDPEKSSSLESSGKQLLPRVQFRVESLLESLESLLSGGERDLVEVLFRLQVELQNNTTGSSAGGSAMSSRSNSIRAMQ